MRLNRRASLLCYLLLAACGGGGATAPVDAAIVGSYQLQTINGFAVPAVYVQSATGKVEILDDVYTLNADRNVYRSRAHSHDVRHRRGDVERGCGRRDVYVGQRNGATRLERGQRNVKRDDGWRNAHDRGPGRVAGLQEAVVAGPQESVAVVSENYDS